MYKPAGQILRGVIFDRAKTFSLVDWQAHCIISRLIHVHIFEKCSSVMGFTSRIIGAASLVFVIVNVVSFFSSASPSCFCVDIPC